MSSHAGPAGDTHQQQQQQQQQLETTSSSSWTRNCSNNNAFISNKESKVEESDEDLFTVPDVETPSAVDSAIVNNDAAAAASTNSTLNNINPEGQTARGRRGRNPVDKEYRRLKRLLRNRVSAQQARERKKAYVNDLELRAQELQDKNGKLEEKISTLINENTMLRKVLMNTRPKADEEPKQD